MLAIDSLGDMRAKIRSGCFSGNTSGLMPSLVQGNVVIMPKQWADEFLEFCRMNPKPCPVIGVSNTGEPFLPELGEELDIRIDIPEYHLLREGAFTKRLLILMIIGSKTQLLLSWVVLFPLRMRCNQRVCQ